VAALAVVFTPRAARQIEAASGWWAEHRQAAPDALQEELTATLSLLSDQPTCGVPVAGPQRAIRRVLLRRVGYHLYYRVLARGHQLQVVAFWHARRGSSPT
jgi:plasmid stabilization system protein ParE